YFRDFPGTITLHPQTLTMLVQDVCVCLIGSGFRHIVLFNGHNGNGPALSMLTRQLRADHGLMIPTLTPLGYVQSPRLQRELYPEGYRTGHGGEPVGSIQSYLQPDLVDTARAEEWGIRAFHGLQPDGLSGVRFEDILVGMPL